MDVEIKQIPELRVATVHHVGPYTQIDKAFGKLGEIAGAAGLFEQPNALMVGIYYDDPESTAADELQSDAGVTVSAGASIPHGLGETTIPAGAYACTLHRGPYDTLPAAWATFGEAVPAAGHQMKDGPGLEVYLNTPMDTPPDKLLTELRVPIEK